MLPGRCRVSFNAVVEQAMGGSIDISSAAFISLRQTSKLFAPFVIGASGAGLCNAEFCTSLGILMMELLKVVTSTYPAHDAAALVSEIPASIVVLPNSGDREGNLFELPTGATSGTQIPEREFFEYGSFFPGYFLERSLRSYVADDLNSGYLERDLCTKHAYLGGSEKRVLFIMTCAGCNMVLGFSVLNCNESPRALFELIFTRFKIAPEAIIYDNACNASLYCLKREPEFFENTDFMVDKMHIRGHTNACSPAYHPSSSVDQHDDVTGRRLNTQRCEQVNSFIQDLSGQAKLMTVSNYLFSIRDFLAQLNALVESEQMLQ